MTPKNSQKNPRTRTDIPQKSFKSTIKFLINFKIGSTKTWSKMRTQRIILGTTENFIKSLRAIEKFIFFFVKTQIKNRLKSLESHIDRNNEQWANNSDV